MELSKEECEYLSRLVYEDKRVAQALAGSNAQRLKERVVWELNRPGFIGFSATMGQSGFSAYVNQSGISQQSGRSGFSCYTAASGLECDSPKAVSMAQGGPFIGLSGISGYVPHGVKKPGYVEMPENWTGPAEGGMYNEFRPPSGASGTSCYTGYSSAAMQEFEWRCSIYKKERGPITRTIYAANEALVLALLIPLTEPKDIVDVVQWIDDGQDVQGRPRRFEREENGFSAAY